MDTTHADYIDDSNDVGDIAQHTTADNHAFKKRSQTVGRPPVTNHNIHDDYMRDPPDVSAATDPYSYAWRLIAMQFRT